MYGGWALCGIDLVLIACMWPGFEASCYYVSPGYFRKWAVCIERALILSEDDSLFLG